MDADAYWDKDIAKPLGAQVVRPLTEKESNTETKDGAYDIEL